MQRLRWRSSWSKRAQVAAIAGVGYPLVNALGHTLRWRVEGLQHLDAIAASGRQPVMAFWHGRILPATYYFRRRGIVVITSENFDGEWIARIIERFGYGTARGSTSRGGLKAMHQLVRRHAGRAPRGLHPRWPARPAQVAQPGAVWLAAATGNPLLPFHLEASSYWSDGAGTGRRSRSRSARSHSSLASRSKWRRDERRCARDVRVDLERRLVSLEERARTLLAT